MTLNRTLDEALAVHNLRKTSVARPERIDELLLTVGLAPREQPDFDQRTATVSLEGELPCRHRKAAASRPVVRW
jgi:hypothetical protein